MRLLCAICFLLTLFIVTPAHVMAASQGTVTMLDGKGSLIRGTSRYTLVKGIELQQGDILELNDNSLTQVEFGDGTAVSFGEQSRVMFFSALSGKRTQVEIYILRGIVKASSAKGAKQLQIDTPLMNIAFTDATGVISVSPTEAEMFFETGGAKITAGRSGVKIKEGEYCSIKAGKKPAVMNRPPQSFIANLPIPFRDSLPSLLTKTGNRKVQLGKPLDFSYKEVEPWLDSKPTVRRYLANQWNPKAHDPSFRKELIHNMHKHPEWGRVLSPEKNVNNVPKAGAEAAK